MSDYVYLKYNHDPTLLDLPVPVRQDRLPMVMGDGRMHADVLLDELNHFLINHPEYHRHYAELAGRLSYLTGMQMAGMGLWDAATHYLEIGSRWCPQNLSVRLNHAVALHLAGHYAAALDEYRQALADPEILATPLVTILAARCCWELGLWSLGAELLRALSPLAPREPAFWEFLSQLEEKAAQGPKARAAPSKEPAVESTAPRTIQDSTGSGVFCTKCGVRSSGGDRFCRHCGQPLRELA